MSNSALDRGAQQGDVAWLIAIVLLVIIIFGLGYIGITAANDEFKQDCRKAGGIPVINRSGRLCYASNTVIEIR